VTWGCAQNTTVLNVSRIPELAGCVGKLQCTYFVSYKKLGDPCPNKGKIFSADFTCTPPPPSPPPSPKPPSPPPPNPPFPPGAVSLATCDDGGTCQLSCAGATGVAVVHSAIWQCDDKRTTCGCSGGDDCCPIDLSDDVKAKCLSLATCSYPVSYSDQGDSCPGAAKILEIVYTCSNMPPPSPPVRGLGCTGRSLS
jgi:hypothetical protein